MMTIEIKRQLDLKEKLEAIKHPNIQLVIYPPDKRLVDLNKSIIFYPISEKNFVLMKLHIVTNNPSYQESSEFLFLSNFIFIESSMGLDFYQKSDGSLDAKPTSCKLLYQRTGIKKFSLFIDEVTNEHQLILDLNDGNAFRSVKFESEEKIPDNFISLLNESLKINKWL